MDFRTPPLKLFRDTSVKQGKEDDDAGDGDRAVQRGAEHEVVAPPPDPLPPLDDEPEKQAHDGPAAVVGAGRGRDVVEATHEQRHVDPSQPCGAGENALAEHVDDDWQQGADKEEPQQISVHGALGEEATWTQSAPHHAGVEVGAGKRAGEAVGGLLSADVRDVVEGPVKDRDLAEATDDETHRLDEEEVPGWNLGDFVISPAELAYTNR